MAKKINVTAGSVTALQAKTGIVVVILFLVFGIGFAYAVLQDMPSSENSLRMIVSGFFVIWIVVCISLLVTFIRLGRRHGDPDEQSLLEIHGMEPKSFEERLRALEALKRDGLLSESEYQAKRKQIMKEPW